jgi:hypothetical protein
MPRFADFRKVGPSAIAARLVRQLWSETAYLELVSDVEHLPELPPGMTPTRMEPTEPGGFGGFRAELAGLSGDAAIALLNLEFYRAAGMRGLHVAWSDDGQPMYAQWALTSDDRATMPSRLSAIYPYPSQDEVLVEGAYTFVAFRRRGLMTTGMHDLLVTCRSRGVARVVTLVLVDNVPALRACASCGFHPAAVRLRRRRLGYRYFLRRPLAPEWSRAWDEATATSAP